MLRVVVAATLTVLFVGQICSVSAQSYPVLPGVENIGLGWLPQYDTFGRPVFDLTYNRRLFITSPYDKEKYAIPDYIGTPGCVRTAEKFSTWNNQVFNSTRAFVESKTNSMNISASFPGLFEFRMENTNSRMKEFLNYTYNRYAVTGEKHLYWTIRAPPAIVSRLFLSQEIKMVMRETKGVFDINDSENLFAWRTLFDYYGTHFLSQMELGGSVHMETKIDISHLRDITETRIRRELTLKLGTAATPNTNAPSTPSAPNNPSNGQQTNQEQAPESEGDGGGEKRSTSIVVDAQAAEQTAAAPTAEEGESSPWKLPEIKWGVGFSIVKEQYRKMMDETFRESSIETIRLIGGRANSLKPDHWREWVPTIIELPEPLDKMLVPLVDALANHPDIPNSREIRRHYNAALNWYQNVWMAEADQGQHANWATKKRALEQNPIERLFSRRR